MKLMTVNKLAPLFILTILMLGLSFRTGSAVSQQADAETINRRALHYLEARSSRKRSHYSSKQLSSSLTSLKLIII